MKDEVIAERTQQSTTRAFVMGQEIHIGYGEDAWVQFDIFHTGYYKLMLVPVDGPDTAGKEA